mmetsp:Transcript_30821/g.57585  ORF Transcript_30821/g.57585 Transcript_30821/m.57585 type:complete len:205 (+) Transcript_30821:519-1133(+)
MYTSLVVTIAAVRHVRLVIASPVHEAVLNMRGKHISFCTSYTSKARTKNGRHVCEAPTGEILLETPTAHLEAVTLVTLWICPVRRRLLGENPANWDLLMGPLICHCGTKKGSSSIGLQQTYVKCVRCAELPLVFCMLMRPKTTLGAEALTIISLTLPTFWPRVPSGLVRIITGNIPDCPIHMNKLVRPDLAADVAATAANIQRG